jgi:predicted RNA binding protein YcfA (HicA-like mRNA interferase family)
MKYSELKKVLRQHGCYKINEGRSHEIWFSPMSGQSFPVGRHNTEDVRKGIYNIILKQAGIKNRR